MEKIPEQKVPDAPGTVSTRQTYAAGTVSAQDASGKITWGCMIGRDRAQRSMSAGCRDGRTNREPSKSILIQVRRDLVDDRTVNEAGQLMKNSIAVQSAGDFLAGIFR